MKDQDSIEPTDRPGALRHSKTPARRKPRSATRARSGETRRVPQVIARIPRVPRCGIDPAAEPAERQGCSGTLRTLVSSRFLMGTVLILVTFALAQVLVPRILNTKRDSDSASPVAGRGPQAPAPDAPPAPRWNASLADAAARPLAASPTDRRRDEEYRPGSTAAGRPALPWASPSEGDVLTRMNEPANRSVDASLAAEALVDQPIPQTRPTGDRQYVPTGPAVSAEGYVWQSPGTGQQQVMAAERAIPEATVSRPQSGPDERPRPGFRGPRSGGLVNGLAPQSPEGPPSDSRTAVRPGLAPEEGPSGWYDARMVSPETRSSFSPPSPTMATGEAPGAGVPGVDFPRDLPPPRYSSRPPANPYQGYVQQAYAGPNNPPQAPAMVQPREAVAPPGAREPSGPETYASGYPATGYPSTEGTLQDTLPPYDLSAPPPAPGGPRFEFEGIIEKPTARTPYERTRPSYR